MAAQPHLSFEFFPPMQTEGEDRIIDGVSALARFTPQFASVTCGADGGNRQGTARLVERLTAETGVPATAHMTCVGVAADALKRQAEAYWQAGIRRLVALRGDGASHPDGPQYAEGLVRLLLEVAPFDISVAAYPETHPEAASPAADLDNLQRKLDAGAARAISQFFFAPETFLRFRERAAKAGIEQELVPGILPLLNIARVKEFAVRCGAALPGALVRRFEAVADDKEARLEAATETALALCRALQAGGVRHLHIYTLNNIAFTERLCRALRASE